MNPQPLWRVGPIIAERSAAAKQPPPQDAAAERPDGLEKSDREVQPESVVGRSASALAERSRPRSATASPAGPASVPRMLAPTNAWRILCRRTGGNISRATFYRWLSSGKIYSVRMGFRILVPWPSLEDVIKQCLAGERF